MLVRTSTLPPAIREDYQRSKELRSVAILELPSFFLKPARMSMLHQQIGRGEQLLKEQRNMVAWTYCSCCLMLAQMSMHQREYDIKGRLIWRRKTVISSLLNYSDLIKIANRFRSNMTLS